MSARTMGQTAAESDLEQCGANATLAERLQRGRRDHLEEGWVELQPAVLDAGLDP